MTSRLDHLNELPAEAAIQQLMTCLRSRVWAADVLSRRPYRSLADVEDQAMAAARGLPEGEVAAALAAHPRIGERPEGTDAEAGFSRAEQAGVGSEAATTAALREVNEAYEARFGHVFLVRAAGRDAAGILAAARERLTHDPATEGRVVREQLGEIAVLRLRTLLDGPGGHPDQQT
ncbi:MAG: 2-oxo-4-hydroxy-4-carboxy-5-ureidoimidazoline decarboxylase [Kineosporiaceae bacterium]